MNHQEIFIRIKKFPIERYIYQCRVQIGHHLHTMLVYARTKVSMGAGCQIEIRLTYRWYRGYNLDETYPWTNIGSYNGLLPDGTKFIVWTDISLSSVWSHEIHLSALS